MENVTAGGLIGTSRVAPPDCNTVVVNGGAQLGDFMGHSVGAGPALSYVTKLGKDKKVDLAKEIEWLPEIEVDKRLKGDFVWFKLGFAF